jgi:uncharacterized membrane protein YiaA
VSVHSLSIVAFPLGILFFLISLYVIYKAYKNKRIQENSFWIALFVFSVLFAIMTTLGRGSISFEYTDRSRYTSFTSLMILSMIMMFYDVFNVTKKIHEKKLFKLLFFGLIVFAIGLDAIGIGFGFYQKRIRQEAKEIVLDYKNKSDDELYTMCGGCGCAPCKWCEGDFEKMVRDNSFFLEENHYSVFGKSK